MLRVDVRLIAEHELLHTRMEEVVERVDACSEVHRIPFMRGILKLPLY
jgi:hypothetical protein